MVAETLAGDLRDDDSGLAQTHTAGLLKLWREDEAEGGPTLLVAEDLTTVVGPVPNPHDAERLAVAWNHFDGVPTPEIGNENR